MPLLSARLRRRKAVWISLLLLIAGAVALLCLRSPPPPVVILPVADGFGSTRPSWFNRGKAALPTWVHRWKQGLFGSPTQILLEVAILDLPGPAESVLTDARLPRTAALTTNGVEAWVLVRAELTALRLPRPKNPIRRARMQLADGIDGSLSTGENVVIGGIPTLMGLQVRFSPRVHDNFTDLTTALVLTEAPLPTSTVTVRTNLSLAARIQLRDGYGVFLMAPDSNPTNSQNFGILIYATPIRGKK